MKSKYKDIDAYYSLIDQQLEGLDVLYDLCLLNGWASDTPIYPRYISRDYRTMTHKNMSHSGLTFDTVVKILVGSSQGNCGVSRMGPRLPSGHDNNWCSIAGKGLNF
jgi:hypothetical protein